MKKFCSDLIFAGKIPFFGQVRVGILIFSVAVLMFGFFLPENFKKFGEFGWFLLIFILAIRPVMQIFPEFGILKTICGIRRELGILFAAVVFSHSIGYFFDSGESWSEVFSANFWRFDNFLMWGFLGFLITVILVVTSNDFSVRILKKAWKPVQKMAYFAMIFTAGHIFLRKPNIEHFFEVIVPVVFVGVLWILAKQKISFKFFVKN